MSDDFYIGYLPTAAPRLAAHMRRFTLGLILASLGVGALLIFSMGGFSKAAFEFGVEREFMGTIADHAIPSLIVERPGIAADSEGLSSYVLVAFGKHGAPSDVTDLKGRRVRLRGSLIYRDAQTMIEVAAGSVEDLGSGTFTGSAEELGVQVLTGEIVDSKCFLGVMKPGNLKPHRACAVRCISGGIPPVLLVRDSDGQAVYYHLVSPEGEAVNALVLDRVAEPVRVEGRVVKRGGLLFLYADPANYRAVP